MKRFVLFALVLGILFGLCACGSAGSGKGPVTIESCRFAEEVRAADGECVSMYYPDGEGKVYVDVVLAIRTDTTISENAFSGYVTYDAEQYPLQYAREGANGNGLNEDDVTAPGGRVHMFTSLPDDAQDSKLTAVVTVNGTQYTAKVGKKLEKDPLKAKTKVKAGDKESVWDGKVTFEVVSCKYTEVIKPQNPESTAEYKTVDPVVDLVLKVTNNLEGENQEIKNIFGYLLIDGELYSANDRMEINNNTELDYDTLVAPGKTAYVHIFANAEDAKDPDSLIMRFNIGGNCYYCEVE